MPTGLSKDLKRWVMAYSIRHRKIALIIGRLRPRRNRIDSLGIHITRRCNLSCTYCYEKSYRKGNIGTEAMMKIIRESGLLGIKKVVILGGEPLLHEGLYDMIRLCCNNGRRVTLFTNGILINRSWIKRLRAFGDRIELVFKMDSPNTYKAHTGSDAYGLLERNMRACSRSGLNISAFIVATKMNFRYISDIVQRSLELGAVPTIERYIPLGVESDKRLELTPPEFLSAIRGFYSGISRYTGEPVDDITDGVRNASLMLNMGFCGCYTAGISVASNGDITHCPMAGPGNSVGNVSEVSLEAILKEAKNHQKRINTIPKECKGCPHSRYCRGGCKTYAVTKTGSYDRRDPLCTENSMLWASRIAIETYLKARLPSCH